MHPALRLLALLALAPALLTASDAFNHSSGMTRSVQAVIVTDASAYLAIAANSASPHDCFVDVSAGGKMSVTFDAVTAECSAGTGTGIPGGDGSDATKYGRFAFHDIVLITNKGTKTELVWVNATTSSAGSSALMVAKKSTSGAMADVDYYANSLTSLSLAPGAVGYVGIRVNSGTLASGNSVTGTISIVGRR